MSYIMVNVQGADREVHQQMHGADADRLIAALSADPETVAELELAVGRFVSRSAAEHRRETAPGSADDQLPPRAIPDFIYWEPGPNHVPYDAGILFIDLIGRVAAAESSYSALSRRGKVQWHDGDSAGCELGYVLADDWLLLKRIDSFACASARRRAERNAAGRHDDRKVLYDACPEFLAAAVFRCQDEIRAADDEALHGLVREIHVRWLMTPRDDLAGASPRDRLINERHEHLEDDLQCQQTRWSRVGSSPPGIPRDSSAYRYAGFGRHEIVLYHELVRELAIDCAERVRDCPLTAADVPGEVDRLSMRLQQWLHDPQPEELIGKTPAAVIDRERRRLPECVSGEAAMIDCDCPICQMMADGSLGPTFWGLDGSHLDDDFAFSFHQSYDEWKAEQAEWDFLADQWETARQRDAAFVDGRSELDEYLNVDAEQARIWQSSYSNREATAELTASQALPLLLFGIGAHLAEIGLDLGDSSREARALREDFARLRQAIDDTCGWLVRSAGSRFADTLDQMISEHPALAAKGDDLTRQIEHLVERCGELFDTSDDGAP